MSATTYVELRLPPSGVRRWHLDLAQALGRYDDLAVGVAWVDGPPAPARDLERLLAIESRIHRLPRAASSRVARHRLAHLGTRPPDSGRVLRLDLGGARVTSTRQWSLRFDGLAGEEAAAAALLAGRFPLVELVDPSGAVVASGRPGSERPGVTAAALDDVLAGCVRLVVAAVTGHSLRLPEGGTEAGGRSSPRSPAEQALRALASAPLRRAARAVLRTPHWRVGWRFVDGPGLIDSLRHPAEGWQDLPDDGHHFYADPFPIQVAGRTHLFVEDFDHRVGRGVVSVVEFDEHGPVGTPVCVLEHDVHLSYPFVLEHDGEVWMIPETSAAGTVELYRAADFPHHWVRHSVLLRDLDANDVTPFRHQGRWWLSATVRRGGSCSDALHLWHADDLRGPWTAHRGNPVVLDIASARPAGRVVEREGRLVRPAQDGTGGYGSALTLAEVVRLDPTAYEQRVVGRVTAGPGWAGTRLHTLNRAGRLEVIDGSSRSLRIPLPGRVRTLATSVPL
ncbi:formyl transferase [Nocardioides lijunqiniae]|uniref:glucosamine inositolphosphorylceramide transferase family protein n=1 Tax=Nocardioides lijunqiniae TaxID=2760832 RepID=UPI001877FB98|nr:formyl transferase [Nocardioides lijunqiniae]